MIIVHLVGDERSLSEFANAYVAAPLDDSESVKKLSIRSMDTSSSTHEASRRVHLVGDSRSLDELEHVPQPLVSKKKKYNLPKFATKVVRHKGESIHSFLLRSLGSQVVKFGLSYLGKNADETELGKFLFYLEVLAKTLEVARDLEAKHADELQGMRFDQSQLVADVNNRFVPFVLETFDRDKYDDMSRRGAAAGRKGTKYDDLAGYLRTVHLGRSAAAKALGITPPTLDKMRRQFADIDISTGEIHETTETTPQHEPAEPDQVGYTARTEARATGEHVATYVSSRGIRENHDAHRAGEDREITRRVEHPLGHRINCQSISKKVAEIP